ncbi:ABC-three component system protein [uncultured Flavobacterium sp.]|uniref:ABC-three component system protein n=1 Tax=uncultured Flavobacterium sp. TaxID=165435 RepID=UPI0030EEF3A1|tara:strand:+ start:64525 stop:65115 length:591 start_codon:yes stop_codon:yes gene_type:complete
MLDNENLNEVTQSDNIIENGDLAGRDINKSTYNIGRITFGGQSQLEKLYERLEKEKNESTIFSEIVDELLHFKSNADDNGFIGLEKKLENGNRINYLHFAETSKEKFAKKLLKNEHSETAQLIYAFLLAKVYSSFQTNIYPRIYEGLSEEFINQLVTEYIIKPLEDILGNNLLRIYDDEINGMIYFLTGNCHIKWN